MPLPALIEALLQPAAYPHPAETVRLIETHISWVLLAGEFAYKIKKPVDFGFLDFSTLERRRFCCEEEIRLNRRLAPEIYLDTVAIRGPADRPRVQGDGEVIEWAVRMRAFPAESTLDRATAITPAMSDAIADRVARFHMAIPAAPADSEFGSPAAVMLPVRENFAQLLESFRDDDAILAQIKHLAAWSEAEGKRLESHFTVRKQDGFVRDCHGDLHLGNIAWVDDAPLIFDCIEFNPNLRHVDIVSEVAFLFMDLVSRGYTPMAWRFLNRWLEHTGDYAGLVALRFYLVYRAVVRAKVSAIRAHQGEQSVVDDSLRHLELAEKLASSDDPLLILMHGFSGSGKTWLSQRILETLGALRLRSDVERKRLFGLDASASSASVPGGIYTPEATARTFARLSELAGTLLDQGFVVIVDATFLSQSTRHDFFSLAEKHHCPVRLISMAIEPDVLRARVGQRMANADDASEADLDVLEAQLHNADPFDAAEMSLAIVCRSADGIDLATLISALRG